MEQNHSRAPFERLTEELSKNHSLLIAFSGGVDSSFLLHAASEVLGNDQVLAVTARAATFPERELSAAVSFCRDYGIPHQIILTNEVDDINRTGNSPDRCYHCKRGLFAQLKDLSAKKGFQAVAEGSNLDDEGDYRPGERAIRELGILSPLKAARLSKTDIRDLSRARGLPSWDKPAFACLTSRFPYHVTITRSALSMIEQAEAFLIDRGFRQCRVRHYGNRARVEVEKNRVAEALSLKKEIESALTAIGYTEVEIDPAGYRTGSMNVF